MQFHFVNRPYDILWLYLISIQLSESLYWGSYLLPGDAQHDQRALFDVHVEECKEIVQGCYIGHWHDNDHNHQKVSNLAALHAWKCRFTHYLQQDETFYCPILDLNISQIAMEWLKQFARCYLLRLSSMLRISSWMHIHPQQLPGILQAAGVRSRWHDVSIFFATCFDLFHVFFVGWTREPWLFQKHSQHSV